MSDELFDNGMDTFKDNRFSYKDWSALTLKNPKEIKDYIDRMNFVGRKIKDMRIIGLCYNLERDCVMDYVLRCEDQYGEKNRMEENTYDTIDPSIMHPRYAEIDEPLMIKFEDGDVFEIEVPFERKYSISMNKISWWIDAGTNDPNMDADILFLPCMGQTVADIELDIKQDNANEYVDSITIRLENGCGLRITAWIDFTEIYCVDENNQDLQISIRDLKEHLYNWEDLHEDDSIGFYANSPEVFVNAKGDEHTEEPYMTFAPQSGKCCIHMCSWQNFTLFAWSISKITRDWFDEYGDYHFNYEQWQAILNEAERLLGFDTFDSLFEYMKAADIPDRNRTDNIMLDYINRGGVEFWKNRDKYRTQLDDIKRWTELVMGEGEYIDIYGF